jgi:hypothetical protein
MGKFLIHANVLAKVACSIINPREGEVIQPFKKGVFNKTASRGQARQAATRGRG